MIESVEDRAKKLSEITELNCDIIGDKFWEEFNEVLKR